MKNINDLKQQLEKGKKFKYLFFWGHRQKSEQKVDKSCFSQWFPKGFTLTRPQTPVWGCLLEKQ